MPYQTATSTVPVEHQREMVRLYKQGRSLQQIADEFYWAKSTVSAVLRLNGVPKRSRGGGRGGCARFVGRDGRRIAQMYRDGWSLADLARRFNTFDSTIYRTLQREGVQLRSRSEAISLARRAKLATAGAAALTPRQRRVLGIL